MDELDRLKTLHTTDNIVDDAKSIINSAQSAAYIAVNTLLLARNWLLGKRIAEEELKSAARSETYGREIIKTLSNSLMQEYGKGFTKTALYSCYSFYKLYPDIFQTLSGKSSGILS